MSEVLEVFFKWEYIKIGYIEINENKNRFGFFNSNNGKYVIKF